MANYHPKAILLQNSLPPAAEQVCQMAGGLIDKWPSSTSKDRREGCPSCSHPLWVSRTTRTVIRGRPAGAPFPDTSSPRQDPGKPFPVPCGVIRATDSRAVSCTRGNWNAETADVINHRTDACQAPFWADTAVNYSQPSTICNCLK